MLRWPLPWDISKSQSVSAKNMGASCSSLHAHGHNLDEHMGRGEGRLLLGLGALQGSPGD